MSQSSEFQTGGVVLLAVSVVFCGISVAVLLPLIQGNSLPHLAIASAREQVDDAAVKTSQEFAEFYPSQMKASEPPLRRTTSASDHNFHARVSQASAHAQAPPNSDFTNTVSTSNVINHSQQSTTQQHQTTVASTQRSASVDTAAFQPPANSLFAPITVHPVTVNVDGSLFGDEVKALAERVETAIRQNEQDSAADFEDRRQSRIARTQTKERRERDEDIAKIGAGVEQLAASFRQLQDETRRSLQEAQQTSSRSQVSTQLLESYQQALQKEQLVGKQLVEQQLAQQRLMQQQILDQQVAQQRLAEQRLAQQTLEHQQRIAEQQLAQQKIAEQTLLAQQRLAETQLALQQAESTRIATRTVESRSFETHSGTPPMGYLPPKPTSPTAQREPVNTQQISEPRHFEANPISTSRQQPVAETSAIDQQSYEHSQSASFRAPVPIRTAVGRSSEQQVLLRGEGLQHRGSEVIDEVVETFVIPTLPQLAVPPTTMEKLPADAALESRSLQLMLPDNSSRTDAIRVAPPTTERNGDEDDAVQLFPVDINLPVSSLKPVEPSRRMVEPVGYEHVYSFKMEEAEDGTPLVVEQHQPPTSSGVVCSHCGRIHPENTTHVVTTATAPTEATKSTKLTNTAPSHQVQTLNNQSHTVTQQSNEIVQASINLPPSTMQSTAAQNVVESSASAHTVPSNEHKRTNSSPHVGGRGMNRHVKQADGQPAATGLIPKLRTSTLTTEEDEPGVLHRMTSTLKQLGRSVQ